MFPVFFFAIKYFNVNEDNPSINLNRHGTECPVNVVETQYPLRTQGGVAVTSHKTAAQHLVTSQQHLTTGMGRHFYRHFGFFYVFLFFFSLLGLPASQ